MVKYKIEKFNGKSFLVKVRLVKGKSDTYQIWYREDRFLRKWKFICLSNDLNSILQTIYCHFGFTSIVHQV